MQHPCSVNLPAPSLWKPLGSGETQRGVPHRGATLHTETQVEVSSFPVSSAAVAELPSPPGAARDGRQSEQGPHRRATQSPLKSFRACHGIQQRSLSHPAHHMRNGSRASLQGVAYGCAGSLRAGT